MKLCACGQPARYKYCAGCADKARRVSCLASARRSSANNPERTAETKRRWANNNREKIKYSVARRKETNPDLDVESKRKPRLKKYYGITIDQWEFLFDAQGRRCAICGASESLRAWHTDHDHVSNKVRGILCFGCNTGIGLLRDSSSNCHSAAAYLTKHGR